MSRLVWARWASDISVDLERNCRGRCGSGRAEAQAQVHRDGRRGSGLYVEEQPWMS